MKMEDESVNLYPFIPPAFALYLLLISKFQEGYVKSNITDDKAQTYALDAIARLEFFNGFFAALVAVFVTYSTSKAFGLMTITAIVLVALFIPLLFVVIGQKAGDMHAKRPKLANLRYSTITRTFLVVVNLILIGAIYADQQATRPTPAPPPAKTAT